MAENIGIAQFINQLHNGAMHQESISFQARIICKWSDEMQQDVSDVTIRHHNDAFEIEIKKTLALESAGFPLHFSTAAGDYQFEAGNRLLIITGNSNKQGTYSIEIIPEN